MTTTATSELPSERASLSRESLLRVAAVAIVAVAAIGVSLRAALPLAYSFAHFVTPPAYALVATGFVTLHPRLRGHRGARLALSTAGVLLLLGVISQAASPWIGFGIAAKIVSAVSFLFALISLIGAPIIEVRSGPTPSSGSEPRAAAGWPRVILLFLVAFACFAVSGVNVLLTLALLPMIVLLALPTIHGCRGTTARLALATLVGFGVAWLGVAMNVTRFAYGDTASALAWEARFAATDEHFKTLMVTGFPLQGIEGHGEGGARDYLPFQKGLGILVANFVLCVTGAGLLGLLLVRFRQSLAIAIAAAFALVAGGIGAWHLLVMLD